MDFIKHSRIWLACSSILISLGIITLLVYGLPLGIDFTGGSEMRIQFVSETEAEIEIAEETAPVVEGEEAMPEETEEAAAEGVEEAEVAEEPVVENTALMAVNTESIREVLTPFKEKIGEPLVFTSGENGFIIRTKEIDDATHTEIKQALTMSIGPLEETAFTAFSATVGETLKWNAIIAVLIAIVGIVFFIAYSFRKVPKRVSPWRFSITAIIALIHDVFITVGVFAFLSHFFGYEANTLFITALLTILGYSVNDTIVVFDRIRENLKYQERGQSFGDIANKSLNQTITRSFNTSLTTLITLFFLFLFGGETIKFFVLTLIIGFIAGTYSSIFVATPLLVYLRKKRLGNS